MFTEYERGELKNLLWEYFGDIRKDDIDIIEKDDVK